MGQTQRHHIHMKARQKDVYGEVIDDRTTDLETEYHKEITAMQMRGYSNAYLAGKIDCDRSSGRTD